MSSEYTQLISQLRENQRSNNKNAAEITTSLQHTAGTYSEYASTITRELQETRASNFAAVNQISSYIQNSNNSLMSTMMNATYGIQGVIQDSSRAVIISQTMLAQKLGQELNTLSNTINTNLSFLHSEINSLKNTIAEKADAFIKLQNALYDLQKNPRRTQSQEAYVRAEDNYKNKFYKEALEECNLAIENFKTDFMSWYLLGHIYLFGAGEFDNVIDVDKAIEAFENAAKYISPYVNENTEAKNLSSEIYYFLGFARLAKSNDLLVENKPEESEKFLIAAELASRKSFDLSNRTRLVAGYELAKELHFLEREDEALQTMEEIIRANENFALKASSDPTFGSMPIEDLIKRLRDELVSKIKPELDEYARQIEILSNIDAWNIKSESILTELKSLLPNQDIYETYFSVREFYESGKVEEIQNSWKKLEILCLGNDSYESGLMGTYSKAKEAHSSGNDEDALNRLKILIKDKWYFYVKARCDKAFETIWSKIDELLNNLREEILSPIKEEIEEYDRQVIMLSEIEAYNIQKSNQLTDLKLALPQITKIEQMNYFTIREFKENSMDNIRQKMNILISYCLNGYNSDLFQQNYSSVYDLYTSGNIEQALNEIKSNICNYNYWYYAVKVRCDKNFESLWGKIDEIIKDRKEELINKIQNYCSKLRAGAQSEFMQLKNKYESVIHNVEKGFEEIETVHQKWDSISYFSPDFEEFNKKKKSFPSDFHDSQAYLKIDSIAKETEANLEKNYFSIRETWEKLNKKTVSDNINECFTNIVNDGESIENIFSKLSSLLSYEESKAYEKQKINKDLKKARIIKRCTIGIAFIIIAIYILTFMTKIVPPHYFQSKIEARQAALKIEAETQNTSLLLDAIKNNENIETIELYIKKGANPNGMDTLHPTPLIYAAEMHRSDIIKLLIDSGADVSKAIFYIFAKWEDEEPDSENAISAKENMQKRLFFLDMLLLSGVDPNFKDSHGETPLMYAVNHYDKLRKEKYINGAEILINAGADVNAKNNKGQTALKIANNRNIKAMASLLKKYNAKE